MFTKRIAHFDNECVECRNNELFTELYTLFHDELQEIIL